ncbi:MAG: helix-turn-helix domain-containing protein [Gemmatimonadaceae bacterium]|nr:helix-turn-helix domain-containing protein [Gemmatimonadaceae bacterium]
MPLTDTEYRVLVELAIDLETLVTYEDLQQQVWGLPPSADRRTLRSTVSTRRKLGDQARNPTCIFKESKVGYRLGGAE